MRPVPMESGIRKSFEELPCIPINTEVVVCVYDYYYGAQSDQFSFIRVPAVFFKDEKFRGLSTDAKVLYGILLSYPKCMDSCPLFAD